MNENILEFSKDIASIFKTGDSIFLSAPPKYGKSYFTEKVLTNKEKLFFNPSENILIIYKAWQPSYDRLKTIYKDNIVFKQLLEIENRYFETLENIIIVFDDLIQDISNEICETVIVGSHHRNLTIFFLSQSIYYNDKLKFLRKNCNQFIFLSPLEGSSIFRLLSNDLNSNQMQRLKNIFPKIMVPGKFCHILYSRDVLCPPILRFKYDIFAQIDDENCIFEYRIAKIM